MSEIRHSIVCDSCKNVFDLEDVSIEAKIVTKQLESGQVTAVQYYFLCPVCGIKYICFYKDRMVNEYFRLGKKQEAAKRMAQLFEVFENGC